MDILRAADNETVPAKENHDQPRPENLSVLCGVNSRYKRATVEDKRMEGPMRRGKKKKKRQANPPQNLHALFRRYIMWGIL